jgi:hypothetical protein
MATTLSAPGLSDEERVELLALIKGPTASSSS